MSFEELPLVTLHDVLTRAERAMYNMEVKHVELERLLQPVLAKRCEEVEKTEQDVQVVSDLADRILKLTEAIEQESRLVWDIIVRLDKFVADKDTETQFAAEVEAP